MRPTRASDRHPEPRGVSLSKRTTQRGLKALCGGQMSGETGAKLEQAGSPAWAEPVSEALASG